VDYVYLVYNDVPTVYGVDGTDALSTSGPVDVEVFSWSTNLSDPFGNFQDFLDSNHVDGILGIGDNASGPTTSPLESYGGVTVDIPGGNLIIGPNTDTPLFTVHGAPIAHLYETVSTSGQTVVGSAVTNNVDSGGVYGTIPSALASHLQSGSVISVYDHQGGTLLYQYTVGIDSIGQSTAPTAISGTSIDSGVVPFLTQPIYIDYTDHTMSFYGPTS
jgi:hypothetical protein